LFFPTVISLYIADGTSRGRIKLVKVAFKTTRNNFLMPLPEIDSTSFLSVLFPEKTN